MRSEKRPSDDETRTWHIHEDGSWAWEAVCHLCSAPPLLPAKIPYFNIKRLKADNAGHYTQRELGREITDAARADGRDITRTR